MANTFISPTEVVRDASLVLSDNLLIANLCVHDAEAQFARKVGDTVKVKVPPSLGTAGEFSSTTSATNLTETSVDVVLDKHFYMRVDLSSDELTQNVDDFNTLVTIPAVNSLIRAIEAYGFQRVGGGFAPNLVGTAGTAPSTHAHILAGEQTIFDNRGDLSQIVSLVTSATYTSFALLDVFTNVQYGADRPAALATNSLGRIANSAFFRSPNAGAFDRGDIAGTVVCDGDPGTTSVIAVDALTAATGTIKEGTRFTCASDSSGNVYTVTADTAIVGNAASLPVTPAADASVADSDAVTFQTAHKECLMYNPRAVACAIVPGAIVGPNVAAASVKGIGLRIISDVSTSTLAGTWVFDLYAGFKVVRPEYGCIFQG